MTADPAPPPTRTEPPEKETSRTSVAGAREMTGARDTTDWSSDNPATRGNTRMTRSTGDDPLDVWYRAELAATMRPCREYRIGDPTPIPVARSRTSELRRMCPACGVEFSASWVSKHILRRHPQAESGAA